MQKSDLFYHIVPVMLAEGQKTSDVEVLRVGTIQDRGFKITEAMLQDYVKNFSQNVYGTELQVNLEHNRGSAAAGWIKNLYVKGDALFATVAWTELGVQNITKNLFKFVSAELASNYPHHETGKKVNNVFIGLALTNTPALKGQDPIALSEREKQLANTRMLKTLLEEFRQRTFVTKADKDLVQKMLNEATDEEKKENEAAAADVAAKPEADPDAKPAEEKPADSDKPAEGEKKEEQLKEKVDMVKFKEMEQTVATLKEVVNRQEVTSLAETLMLGANVSTGFAGDKTKEELVDFLSELTKEQRVKFTTLLSKVSTVDLATKGETGHGEPDGDEGDKRSNFIAKTAAKMLADGAKDKDGKPMDIEACQRMAAKEYNEKHGK